MKAADTKTTATPAKTNTSFFGKKAADNLFPKKQDDHFFNKAGNGNGFIQTKLTIGQPNDKYEKEADSMADKVIQRLSTNNTEVRHQDSNKIQAKPIAPSNTITPFVQTKCAECEKDEKLQKKEEEKIVSEEKIQKKPIFESNAEPPDDEKNIQRKCAECEKEEKLEKKSDADPQTESSNIESSLSSSKDSGSPLPENTRTQMESSFGNDFSNVRIHNDSSAVKMSKDLNAQAFTHGSDIYFNSGKYDSNSKAGQHLLAHELTHTIQQTGKVPSPKEPVTTNPEVKDQKSQKLSTDLAIQNNKNNLNKDVFKSDRPPMNHEDASRSILQIDVGDHQVEKEKHHETAEKKEKSAEKHGKHSPHSVGHHPLLKPDQFGKGAKQPLNQRTAMGKTISKGKPEHSEVNLNTAALEIRTPRLPKHPALLKATLQIIDQTKAERIILQGNVNARKKIILEQSESKAKAIGIATSSKIAAVMESFQDAKLNASKNFSSSINQIQAQAIVKKVSAQLDGVQAIANLFKETTDKKKMAIETANSKAKEIESFGQSEAKRTHKTNDDSIARINAIAKQTLGKHGTTAEGKAAADKAVMEATKSVIEKLQNNANETASGALETAAGAAGKQRDAGNKFVEEFGKNQSSIIQNIQESVTATVGQIDNAAQKHKENLLDGKSKTLASIQSLRQVVVSGLQTDGKLAETGMRKLGHASANQLDSFAVHGMQQLNANAGKIVEQINSADAKGRRLKKDDEESFPKKVNAAITEGRTGLETVMDEHSENADSNSEKLSQQSLYHLDELSGKSMARAGQFVNTIGSNLSKVHDKAGSQFAQIRVEGQNIHQQGIQKYGESLQQQINSEAQKWDQNKTKTTGDIKAKVDEGLASHFEAEAHAAADFDTAAKKAADDAESSTAWKIIKGIASAAWEFIKGLALFVLIVVIVAIVLFLIVADAVGIFFAVLAIGAILEIALIVVGIGFLVYGLVTSLITRFKQLIATVPAGTPWYDWIALGYLTVIIAVGDVVGVTPIIEGSMGEEAITGRKLTTEERAAKITGGILQIATLFLGEAIRKAGGGGGPAEPVDPVKPVEPGKTVEPGDPTKQLEPDKPTETDKPVEPNKPTTSDTPEHGAKFKEDPVPSADGPERRLGIDDEGKCEVCASPCKEILEKYADVMDPATEAEINAIENDASLTDAEKIERLKPIEKKLANAKLLKAPKIRKEDVTDGPHGPDRPIIDVISRALKDNKPQGRWLSRSAGENAVANLDTSKMVPGKPFSVSIPEGAGEVVRPTEISNRKLPPAERVVEEPAKKAVVILGKDGIIHSFPIGPEHPAFNNNAPLKN